MAQAFDTIVVPTVPGARIATTEATADSATFTGVETLLMSVVAPLVTGRTYRVTADLGLSSDTADIDILLRLRRNTVTGSQIQARRMTIHLVSGIGEHAHLEVEFTAASTANQTFVVGALASAGINRMEAGAAAPCYLYVDYIRDA